MGRCDTPFIVPLAVSVTLTSPPPDWPSTSIRSSSACISAMLRLHRLRLLHQSHDVLHRRSSLKGRRRISSSIVGIASISSLGDRRRADRSATPAPARRRRSRLRTATISAPGKRSSTLRTSGSAAHADASARAPSPRRSRAASARRPRATAPPSSACRSIPELAHQVCGELRRGAGRERELERACPRSARGGRRARARS